MQKKIFSIILPIYNNEKNLPVTIPYILEHMDLFGKYTVELIMVCDGSADNSYEIMKQYQKQYPKLIRIAKFTRNNGQRAAVNCGMKMARGDVIGVISADLQDPFELFAEMLGYWEQGEKLVIAKRNDRLENNFSVQCSKTLHKWIHKYINAEYPQGGFDFFVVDCTIAQVFVQSDTKNNSMQLLLLEIAGKAKMIGYSRQKREVGKSGWSFRKKINQAINIFAVYSMMPFSVLALIGGLCIFASVVSFVMKIYEWVQYGAGYGMAGIYAGLFLVGGLNLCALAMVGIYMFKWMQNLQNMPRYVVEEIIDEMGEET